MDKLNFQKLKHRVTGFTMIELIIALLIGSVLLAWGIPNYRDFKVRRAVIDNTNELIYSLNSARAEAIRYGRNVKVEPDGTWQDGVFTELLNEDGTEQRLAQYDSFGSGITITQSGGFTGPLEFNALGAVDNGLSTNFTIQNSNVMDAQRIVELLPSGTVRIRRP